MPALNQREKRTVRLAVIGLSIYLVIFFGLNGWKKLEASRADYQQMQAEALRLKREILPYENRVLLTQKLKETFNMDPQKLSRTSLAADASAAIQRAASSGGIQLGPIRESAARAAAKELASMQFDGAGPVPAVMGLLHKIKTLGYPIIVDSLQLNLDPAKQGMVKIHMIIVILDYEQWKKEEAPRA
ncbi:MAG: hypothetical protein JWM16_5075 [Verrucomicrobiales bacterium]|nr:hypothetical protein [Verrucomicrobiales bacterium]